MDYKKIRQHSGQVYKQAIIHEVWSTDKCLKKRIKKHVEARNIVQSAFQVPNDEAIRSF